MKVKVYWYVLLFLGVIVLSLFLSNSQSVIIEKKIVNDTCINICKRDLKGKMLSKEFEDFFKELESIQRENQSQLTEIVYYKVEPTQDNERYTELEGGFVTSDTINNYSNKELCLNNYLMIVKKNNAGIYHDLDKYAEELKIELDKNFTIEMKSEDSIILMMKIKKGL